jgi:dethiobiotin synthetase
MKIFRPRGFFVAGTDTGVGKTVVAAAMLAALRERGVRAVPMKPVQTGARLRRGALESPDLAFCLRMNGLRPDLEWRRLMAPFLYRDACSPHLAAGRSARPVSLPGIRKSFAALCSRFEAVVVEGAGGLMVPLNRRACMIDLIPALGVPAVLVARPGLGTLNHTLLSLEALHRRGIRVCAVVVNGCAAVPGYIETDNLRSLRRRAGRVPVLAFPRLREREMEPEAFGRAASRVFGGAIGRMIGEEP